MKIKLSLYIFFAFILLLITNCSVSSQQFVKAYSESLQHNSITALEEYQGLNKNSQYSDLIDSIVLVKTNIDRFNEEASSFRRENKFSDNTLLRLKELVDRQKKLHEVLKLINLKIDSLNLEEELKQAFYGRGSYNYYRNEYFHLNNKVNDYYTYLDFCTINFPHSRYELINKSFLELKEKPTEQLNDQLENLLESEREVYRNYRQDIKERKTYDTEFIFSYFDGKATSAIERLNTLNTRRIYFLARNQINRGDIYDGICNLQLSYYREKDIAVKDEIIGLIEKLDSQSRLSTYRATIALENIYTHERLEEASFVIYTYGDEEPIVLKVKVKLSNHSNDILNLLSYAPIFNFQKIPNSGNEEKPEILYLYSNEYKEGIFKENYKVFPGTQAEETFYYLLDWNAYSGDSIWDLYKPLFNRVYRRINFNQFSSVYSDGNASLYISIDEKAYPINNLIKIK